MHHSLSTSAAVAAAGECIGWFWLRFAAQSPLRSLLQWRPAAKLHRRPLHRRLHLLESIQLSYYIHSYTLFKRYLCQNTYTLICVFADLIQGRQRVFANTQPHVGIQLQERAREQRLDVGQLVFVRFVTVLNIVHIIYI